MSVSLPAELMAFVDSQVEKAGYSTPEEYVRALVREAREREVSAKLPKAGDDESDRRAVSRWENEGGALATPER